MEDNGWNVRGYATLGFPAIRPTSGSHPLLLELFGIFLHLQAYHRYGRQRPGLFDNLEEILRIMGLLYGFDRAGSFDLGRRGHLLCHNESGPVPNDSRPVRLDKRQARRLG